MHHVYGGATPGNTGPLRSSCSVRCQLCLLEGAAITASLPMPKHGVLLCVDSSPAQSL